MKKNLIFILFSVLFLGCYSQETVFQVWNSGNAPPNGIFHKYKGKVSIPFYHIIGTDSINLFITNLDSLLKKVVYPREAERSGEEGGITIEFKLNSIRIAKEIKFLNRFNFEIEKSILDALENFKFKFENDIGKKELDGMLTFSFKAYPQI